MNNNTSISHLATIWSAKKTSSQQHKDNLPELKNDIELKTIRNKKIIKYTYLLNMIVNETLNKMKAIILKYQY